MMRLKIPASRRLAKDLGEPAVGFLESGLNAISRVLSHVETVDWAIRERAQTEVSWEDGQRLRINIVLGIGTGQGHSVPARYGVFQFREELDTSNELSIRVNAKFAE